MESRTLLLLRHAKSAWGTGEHDHERPLAPRGVDAALAAGRALKRHGLVPDLARVSTARRAAATLIGVLVTLEATVPVRLERGLYLCGTAALLAQLRQTPDSVGTLLLIAHNPDMEELAGRLSGAPIAGKYPTAGLARFAVSDGWARLDAATARLIGFETPRDWSPASVDDGDGDP